MLSKVRYCLGDQWARLDSLRAGVDPSALLLSLGSSITCAHRVHTGTLGAGFLVRIGGRHQFVKTHAVPGGRATLEKEIAILSCLYGTSIHVDRIETACAGVSQLWLLMDELVYPQVDFNIAQVLDLIESYSRQLKPHLDALSVSTDDNFVCLLEEGRRSLRDLANNGLLSGSVQEKVESCFSLLGRRVDCFRPYLCHGDLGPKNLMSDGANPIVIDWEDAFWGVEGYDYLFWLTFFNNRKYYSQEVLGKTPWGKEVEIAILVLIVVVKSELSFRSGRYKEDKLTFDERIIEILGLR